MSANGDGNHKFQPFEQDANRRAFMYFNENVKGFYKSRKDFDKDGNNGKGWNFYQNPLDVYHEARRGRYYDYYSSFYMSLVNNLSLSTKWYDYLDLFIGGIGNGIYYRKHRITPKYY